jgi:hypothetical protein
LVATNEFRDLESQQRLRQTLDFLDNARDENITAIKGWRNALGPEPWHRRVHDAIKGTEDTVDAVTEFLSGRYFY